MMYIFWMSVYALFWIAGGIFFYGVSLIPCYLLIKWGMTLSFPWFLFVFPAAFFLFIIVLMLLTGIFKRLFVPKLKTGNFTGKSENRKAGMAFIANRWIVQYLMIPFHSIIYNNYILKYICLRLFGVQMHYTTSIVTDLLSDFSLLKFGKNTTINAYSIIYGHLSPSKGRLIVAATEIGDDCFVGSASSVGCGCKIGDNVFLAYDTVIGLFSKISNHCQIDAGCRLGMGCRLEENVTIGRHSILGNFITVKQGIKIPIFSDIPDYAVVKSQEMAQMFSRIKKQ